MQIAGVTFGEGSNVLHQKLQVTEVSWPFVRRHVCHFTLVAKEIDGSPISVPTSAIACQLISSTVPNPIRLSVLDYGRGKYKVIFTPSRCGQHQVRIMVGDWDIVGSPFDIDVEPSIHPKMKNKPWCIQGDFEFPLLSVAVSGSGVIVLLQNNMNSITLLGEDMKFIRSIGSHDLGPNQLVDVRSIAVTRDDLIVVADRRKKRERGEEKNTQV